jgi:hypothetical protein
MQNQKVMFFDIDGTLLPSGETVFTPSAMDAIKKARANGHLMFINTGRTKANLDDYMLHAGFDGYVCACGTYIILNDRVEFYQHTEDTVCQRVIALAKDCRIDIVFESWHGIYYNPDEILLESSMGLIHALEKHDMITRGFDPQGFNFDKFVTFMRPDSDLSGFVEAVSSWYDYIDRGHGFGEFVPKGHSKATGIQWILDHFHLPLSAAHAVGDSTNDLPMLRYVPHSIAMGNSDPVSLFDEVEFVTRSIDQDGIAYALEHYGFI